MALVYDFMPNGSLEKFIFHAKRVPLAPTRASCILISSPTTSLPDQKLHPKSSDFGLAKLSPQRESAISMMVARGTPGYIAPELISRCYGAVSTKSDVYSYGMMVLEIVGGRKNFDGGVENTGEIYLPLWIHDNLDRYCSLQVSGMTAEAEEIGRKMIIVGLWCIQVKPNRRPSMSMVNVDMFEGSTKDLEMPPRPSPRFYFCINSKSCCLYWTNMQYDSPPTPAPNPAVTNILDCFFSVYNALSLSLSWSVCPNLYFVEHDRLARRKKKSSP